AGGCLLFGPLLFGGAFGVRNFLRGLSGRRLFRGGLFFRGLRFFGPFRRLFLCVLPLFLPFFQLCEPGLGSFLFFLLGGFLLLSVPFFLLLFFLFGQFLLSLLLFLLCGVVGRN